MNKLLYGLLINILVVSFTFMIVSGTTMPTLFVYIILTYISISVGLMLEKPLLKFLTISRNFLTSVIISSLALFAIMYLLEMFMPGVRFGSGEFGGIDLGAVAIKSFELTQMTTMLFASILASAISALLDTLNKSE
jgi:hypothetical protein